MTESMSLAIFDAPAAMVADLVKKNEVQKFDHTTEAGEADLRSWVFRLRGGKGDIEKARKTIKAEALAFGKKVDAKAKELTAPLLTMIAENMKPLDDIEAKKRAEAEAIVQAEIDAKEKAERDRLADLERREAEAAYREAEIQKKEQAEREKQIATEAAKNARNDAERIAANRAKVAEQEKAQAIEKAEREKQEAIEAEKEKARQAELDRIAVEKMEKSVKEKQIADEAKKAANKKHRKSVEDDIYTALLHFVDVGPCASAIVAHMKNGEIPHVTILY